MEKFAQSYKYIAEIVEEGNSFSIGYRICEDISRREGKVRDVVEGHFVMIRCVLVDQMMTYHPLEGIA